MKIRRKFLQLTSYTYPHKMEGFLKAYLPVGFKEDGMGNYYHVVGDNPTTMFACHLDTACSKQEKVIQLQDSKYIRTNGKTILGADDKAGMVVLLYMIEHKVSGLYYFFVGEESGCVGSTKVADNWNISPYVHIIKKVVSFDRRGFNSIITHQFCTRCCSDEFGKELASRLNNTYKKFNFKPDDTGLITDSACFMELVPECTNISVGYLKEHTFNESQDILFLENLCNAVIKINWETLPISRNHLEEKTVYSFDTQSEWGGLYFSYFLIGNEVKKMYISKSQIIRERKAISRWLENHTISELVGKNMGYNNNASIYWDGNSLHIENEDGRMAPISKRVDIMKKIPDVGGVLMRFLRFDYKTSMNELPF